MWVHSAGLDAMTNLGEITSTAVNPILLWPLYNMTMEHDPRNLISHFQALATENGEPSVMFFSDAASESGA